MLGNVLHLLVALAQATVLRPQCGWSYRGLWNITQKASRASLAGRVKLKVQPGGSRRRLLRYERCLEHWKVVKCASSGRSKDVIGRISPCSGANACPCTAASPCGFPR